jgi:UDP-3-O-[3-hydroxymyristoyl] glucosamine N-acyltransferase
MKTFIFGTAGFATEVEWLIFELNKITPDKIKIENFVISYNDFTQGMRLCNLDIISESQYFSKLKDLGKHNCIIAVGSPQIREKIYKKIDSNLTVYPNLIHPSVIMDKRSVGFGKGIIICAGSILTTNIKINDFVQINLDCTIGHNSNINEFTTVSPGVHISGNVDISKKVFIGTARVF